MSYSEFNVRVIWIVFPVDAVYLVEWYLFYVKYDVLRNGLYV